MTQVLDHVRLSLIENMADLADFMEWFRQPRESLACDTETSGFSPELDHIRLIQFGDLTQGWAMDWGQWSGVAIEIIETWQGQWDFHNSKFDIRHIQNARGLDVEDWPWHRTDDTMGMAHILDSQRLKGLKPLAAQHVDHRAIAAQRSLSDGMTANGWDWGTVPIKFPPYWQYGAMDPVLTSYLSKKFKPEVMASYRELYDLELGAIRVAAKMEQTGIRIDRTYISETAKELTKYSEASRLYLADEWNLHDPTPMKLIRFFTDMGVPLLEKFTNGGNQSMDKHVLATTQHPVAKVVLGIRKAEKITDTYFSNILKFANHDDILHPSINTMAARTGRMSITDPALQTLPRNDPAVRNAFVPFDDLSALLTIDADQIEARLTAHFSGDPGLIAAFMAEGDFFCNIATPMYGYDVVKGMPERDNTKSVVYGKVFGASVDKMAETAGVPPQQMAVADAAFSTNFPGVRTMSREIIEVGKRRKAEEGRAYVITPYGRKLKCDTGKEYALVNYLIQCHASEILKRKMVLLDAALPNEARMLLPVHDEIIFDVPRDIVKDVRSMAEEVLNESAQYKVPITWSGDIMDKSWGQKYWPGWKSE